MIYLIALAITGFQPETHAATIRLKEPFHGATYVRVVFDDKTITLEYDFMGQGEDRSKVVGTTTQRGRLKESPVSIISSLKTTSYDIEGISDKKLRLIVAEESVIYVLIDLESDRAILLERYEP